MDPTQTNLQNDIATMNAAINALNEVTRRLKQLQIEDINKDSDLKSDLVNITENIARETVSRSQLEKHAANVAEKISSAARGMDTPSYNHMESTREHCRQAIKTLLGNDADLWFTFHDEIRKTLATLTRQGKLTTIEDYQQAYDDIALGLLHA